MSQLCTIMHSEIQPEMSLRQQQTKEEKQHLAFKNADFHTNVALTNGLGMRTVVMCQ